MDQQALSWLRQGGILVAVLQLASPTAKMVSETPYTSLKSLEAIMRLVDPEYFRELGEACGVAPLRTWNVDLPSGKGFHVAYYVKA